MITGLPITTTAHAIQLAVAPLFLLTGIATVLTNRLGRIIDRTRFLHARSAPAVETNALFQDELNSLRKRARLIHWVIDLCTNSLLLICSAGAILFIGSFIDINMAVMLASLFIAAMFCLILALLNFIREIYLATAHARGGT